MKAAKNLFFMKADCKYFYFTAKVDYMCLI